MNKYFRVVWNDSLGQWQAVGELAKSQGKGTGVTARKLRRMALALSFLQGGASWALDAHMLPTGAVVTTGTATMASVGHTLNINQSTNKASINWQDFSIGAAATVNFNQPSASAVTLNRVVGATPSLVEGALNANGQVLLVNPNGVVFSNGSQINVGGLVATTKNLTDENFQVGNFVFEGNSSASILNLGEITTARGGYVAMMAKEVQNQGRITATLGKVELAGGERFTLNFNGNSLLKLSIDQGTMDALVANGGLIKADGGTVHLTTQAVDQVLNGMVNHTGVIEAQTLENRQGEIVLFAHGGTAHVAGHLDTSAPQQGDGGFIETSGQKIDIANTVRITSDAANGKIGSWLIDPFDITIAASGGDITGATIANALQTTNVTLTTNGTNFGVNLTPSTGTNGDIFINDSIVVPGLINNANRWLTFSAARNIILAAGKSIDATQNSNTQKLNVYFTSNNDSSSASGTNAAKEGAIQLKSGSSIKSNGGWVQLCGAGSDGCGYAYGSQSGSNLNYGILIDGATIDSKGGGILMQGAGWQTSPVSGGGTYATAGVGDVGVAIINGSQIKSQGGSISIYGQGKNSTDQSYDYNHGVWIGRSNGITAGVLIDSGTGSITINGTTPSGGQDSAGVKFLDVAFEPDTDDSNIIKATTGNISITGANTDANNTGSGDGISFQNAAVSIFTNSSSASQGQITLTGTSSAYYSRDLSFSNSITTRQSYAKPRVYIGNDTTQQGNITFNINSFGLNNVDPENVSIYGFNKLTIQPRTTGVGIILNSSLSTPRFNLNKEFFDRLARFNEIIIGSVSTAPQITVGDNASSADFGLKVNDSLTYYSNGSKPTNLSLIGSVVDVKQIFNWTRSGLSPTLTLTASAYAQLSSGASITATNLLLNGSGQYYLNGSSGSYSSRTQTNNIGTLAATGVGNLYLYNAGALTIGSVGGTNGIAASGYIDIATNSGDLTIAQNVSTTSTAVTAANDFTPISAITLNAGKSESAGTSTGGDVKFSGSPTITTGSGGRARIFTGSINGSTGLANLIVQENRQYNKDESSSLSFSSAGIHAIYREDNPIVPIYIRLVSGSSRYGDTPSYTYSLYTASSGGTLVTNASPTGTVIWQNAPSSTSAVGSYSNITYQSGITLGNTSTYSLSTGAANTWTITARPITVTADAKSKNYGDVNPALSYQVSSGNVVNSDSLSGSLSTSAARYSNVGNYAISSTLANSNYDVTYVGADLGITARPITVAADAKSKTYGDANPALSYQVSSGNVVNNDSLSGSLSTTAERYSNVGNYAISSTLANSNYNVTYVGADLGITARPITVSADAKSKTYGDVNPALSYQVSSGNVVNNDSFSGGLATTALAQSIVGVYPISSTLANGNYAITYASADLTISPNFNTVKSVMASPPAERPRDAIRVVSSVAAPGKDATLGKSAQTMDGLIRDAVPAINDLHKNSRLTVVSDTGGESEVATVTVASLIAKAGGQQLRVALSPDSFVELINGGVTLPSGVSQEVYVVQDKR